MLYVLEFEEVLVLSFYLYTYLIVLQAFRSVLD